MQRLVALALTVTLVGSGCAQRRIGPALQSSGRFQSGTSQASAIQRDADDWRRYLTNLPAGTTMSFDLADGSRVTGIILGVEKDVVVVQPRTRLPTPVRRIAFDTIAALTPESRSSLNAGSAIAIGAATGAASFVALFLIMWTALSD